MNQSNWIGALQKPLWEEQPYKMLTSHQNKTTRRTGYKKVYAPPPPGSIQNINGALWNAEQNTNNNS